VAANTNRYHGLFATGATTLDNYTCYAVGTGGEYAILDAMNTLPPGIMNGLMERVIELLPLSPGSPIK